MGKKSTRASLAGASKAAAGAIGPAPENTARAPAAKTQPASGPTSVSGSASASTSAAPPAPALQVIVLGSGGGPLENNVTAFLVRSLASDWAQGSVVAVDAGVHLSAIKAILEETQPANLGQSDGPSLPHTLTTGPFAGLEVHCANAEANAAQIHKNLIETYLITHPHLDHIAGFVINTAGLPSARPKRVAGLPSTIAALKTHVFNNVIWPNLSDENNGAGLVTYMRLVEGGSPAFGEGEAQGYLEICNGLAVKVWSVSHGHCIERHSHRGSSSTRHNSIDVVPTGQGGGAGPFQALSSPSSRGFPTHPSLPGNLGGIFHPHERLQASPAATSRRGSAYSVGASAVVDESVCVYDSSVYFVRDTASGREILMFGDIEPDSISLSPRNAEVWEQAAPKIVTGHLAAIFIECSYDDSRPVDRLFGHLTPRYIAEEMTALARAVVAARQERDTPAVKVSAPVSTSHPSASHPHGQSQIHHHIPRTTRAGPVLIPALDKKRKRISDEGSRAKRKNTPQPATLAPPDHTELADSVGGGLDAPISPRSHNPPPLVNSTASDLDHPPQAPSVQEQRQTSVPVHPLRNTVVQSGEAGDSAEQGGGNEGVDEREGHEGASDDTKGNNTDLDNVLAGLRVIIIHVKECMTDDPPAGEVILAELLAHEEQDRLGVEYVLSEKGGEFLF